MNSVASVLNNQKDPIANWVKPKTLKPNSQLDSVVVDRLLQQYEDLIDVRYTAWFAKHFYPLTFETIHKCASEAKSDAKDSKRLFAFLIKKSYNNLHV